MIDRRDQRIGRLSTEQKDMLPTPSQQTHHHHQKKSALSSLKPPQPQQRDTRNTSTHTKHDNEGDDS
jgi:hypothetical protein